MTRQHGLVAVAVAVACAVALAGGWGCASAHGDRVDPTGSVVAIAATGCRPFPNRALGMVVDDGLVVTVAHAVAGESEIGITTPDGRALGGRVAAIDTLLDAAVLRVDHLDLPPLPQRSYTGGEAVSLVRSDDGVATSTAVEVRRRVTIRTSDIYREGEHLRPGLELGAAVKAGDSGGGIVGEDGSLLGVVWAASRQSDDRAWALSIEAIGPLMTVARVGSPPAPASCAR